MSRGYQLSGLALCNKAIVNYQFVVANEIDEGLGNIRKYGFACHHGVVDSDDLCNLLRNRVLGVQQVVELPSG